LAVVFIIKPGICPCKYQVYDDTYAGKESVELVATYHETAISVATE